MSLWYPTIYRRRIEEVTPDTLRGIGARAVLLDIDNTLTVHDAPEVSDEVVAWLDNMRVAGFSLMLVSNNCAERVAPFAARLGLPYQAHAKKPLPVGFRRAARAMGLPCHRCVVIGDQIFTDILGANLSGMSSVLLEPIEPETAQRFIVFKRRIERWMLDCPRELKRKEMDYGEYGIFWPGG